MDEAAQLERHVARLGPQGGDIARHGDRRGGRRGEQRLDDLWERRGTRTRGRAGERELERRVLDGTERPVEACRGERREQCEPAPGRLLGGARAAGPGRVQRVEPDRAARLEQDRLDAERPCQRAVLTLGIEDHDPPTERGLAVEVGLDQRALAAPDLPEDEDVRVRQDARGVELEGIVDERAAEHVAAHQHPRGRQRAARHEGVQRPELRGRRLVRGKPHAHPRPTGRVQQSASAWLP